MTIQRQVTVLQTSGGSLQTELSGVQGEIWGLESGLGIMGVTVIGCVADLISEMLKSQS
jgi:hypothetical protein